MLWRRGATCVCRYAWECQTQEGGWGLDGCLREHAWKLQGIVNGIDYSEWSPQNDPFLRSDGYRNYGQHDLAQGKAVCKRALQRVCCHTFKQHAARHAAIMSSNLWALRGRLLSRRDTMTTSKCAS